MEKALSSPLVNTIKNKKQNNYYRIKAVIIDNEIIHKSGIHKDYVEYCLRIITDYGKWTIKKRYGDFLKLNNKIKIAFPKKKSIFPPKRLWKASRSTINERIPKLNKYLNYILNNINIFKYRDIVNFLLIDKEILDLFIKKYKMLKVDEDNSELNSIRTIYDQLKLKDNVKTSQRKRGGIIDNSINNINIFNIDNYYESILSYAKKKRANYEWEESKETTPNLIVIREFLHNLCENTENKMIIIDAFESFIIKTENLKFTNKEINELFIGGSDNFGVEDDSLVYENLSKTLKSFSTTAESIKFPLFEKLSMKDDLDDTENESENSIDDQTKGLFYHIGNYKKNVFASAGCLDLLSKLLDTSYNQDAEIYISAFKSRAIYEYKQMDLNNIIKNNLGGNKINVNAMKLLCLIFSDKRLEKYQRDLMIDDIVYKQFINNYYNKILE